MSTYVKRAALIGCSLILLAMICVALLPDSVWKGLIIRSVSHATGRQASIAGKVTVHIFSWHPRLIVEGFSLANAEWAGSIPLLSIRRFDITLQLSSVLRSGLIFPRIGIEEPDVDLERDAAGAGQLGFLSLVVRQTPKTGQRTAHTGHSTPDGDRR